MFFFFDNFPAIATISPIISKRTELKIAGNTLRFSCSVLQLPSLTRNADLKVSEMGNWMKILFRPIKLELMQCYLRGLYAYDVFVFLLIVK